MLDPIILVRTVHIAATVLASGTVCFLVLVGEPAFAGSEGLAALRRRCNWMARIAFGVAVLSGLAWLALLGADVFGEPAATVLFDGQLWPVLTGTQFGAVWSTRFALSLGLGVF